MKIIVLGATGVFGQLLVHELRGAEVIPASRATGTDMRDPDSIARIARGAFAVLCAAGPFQSFDPRCVRAAVGEGAHWLDIGDDPHWFFSLLDNAELDALARSQHVAVVPGLSSLPAISCALVRTLGARTSRPQSPAVSAGDRLPSVSASDRLPSVSASDRLPSVSASDRLPSVSASDRLPSVSASDRLPSVSASDRLPSVSAGDRLPSVSASDRLPSVSASD